MKGLAHSASRKLKISFLGGLAILCVSCASLTPEPTATKTLADEHGDSRAERVFLYESRIAGALLDMYPLVDVFEQTAHPDLIAAEARMSESCSPLTRAVLANLEGQQLSLALRFEVMSTIDDCERAARRIDQLINTEPQTL